ncbi:NUDIX domain-containing protein [Sphingobacterium rhinopitheci]|uniref:NUDIX domain-containing protein n=1 Tax=Sphingobacterium rhinopitheci TaxID=2781960 RepID=UPI001F51EC83|nr:NUDIX domain-containing protein [Sphingobacterium rhinopitheci]MCI0919876.1 NUDIX domain-containing protein [Sphingobacterium rhinopitheci]
MFPFNVRVYGILIDENNRVLISDERTQNVSFTKFPGGGLEYGEGLLDALKREFLEECNLKIEIVRHIYTTDFYEKSSFNSSQIISIYYQVKAIEEININIKTKPFDFNPVQNDTNFDKEEAFRFEKIDSLQEADLTFKTDKIAWKVFTELKN